MRQHPLPHPPIPRITATPADSPVLDIGLVLSLDTFGDVQPPTYSKCRYWLACTDLGGSRFIHLHLLKSRKPSHYIEKLSLIFDDYTLHGHTVRTIRADREFAVPEELNSSLSNARYFYSSALLTSMVRTVLPNVSNRLSAGASPPTCSTTQTFPTNAGAFVPSTRCTSLIFVPIQLTPARLSTKSSRANGWTGQFKPSSPSVFPATGSYPFP